MRHIEHWLGIDTQLSPFYDAWSGVIPSVAAIVAVILVWFSIRIELKALRLETQLLRLELDRATKENT